MTSIDWVVGSCTIHSPRCGSWNGPHRCTRTGTVIIDGPRTFTYAAMAAQANRLAHALIAKGLQPGDRVAYLAPNCAEMLVAHFAVPLAGGPARHRAGSPPSLAVAKEQDNDRASQRVSTSP